jgi:hypothetical protein
MGLRPCQACHRFISDEARPCPHCGSHHPIAPDGTWFDRYHGAVAVALIGLVASTLLFRAQVRLLEGSPPSPPALAPSDSFPGYRSLATSIWRDARLYSRGDRTYVGRITSLACRDPVPRGSFARCFEVEFVDGHREWVRWHVAKEHYLAALPR